jgi:UDP-glucose 4-epimerase
MNEQALAFRGEHVIVTGGLGFIGSNLALELAAAGARVTVVDALTEGDGGNHENLASVADVEVVVGDMGEEALMRPLVERASLVFNLAGKVSHIDSVNNPLADLHANTICQLRFLEVCRYRNPKLRIVYTSTRQIYGKADTPTVTEESPIRPIDPNGISKFAADAYHRMFARDFGMHTVVLRLTNAFGPRQLLRHSRQGFIPWFVKTALEGGEITIFGDGKQTRDVTYVDDVVDALLRAANLPELHGQVFNVGSPFVHSVHDIAREATLAAGSGSTRIVPFPEDRKRIDIGSVACDYSAFAAETGWSPSTTLVEGLMKMVAYFRPRLDAYR